MGLLALSSQVSVARSAYPAATRYRDPARRRVPTPRLLLDNVFDFAEQLLASQREFATHLLAAGMQANARRDQQGW